MGNDIFVNSTLIKAVRLHKFQANRLKNKKIVKIVIEIISLQRGQSLSSASKAKHNKQFIVILGYFNKEKYQINNLNFYLNGLEKM